MNNYETETDYRNIPRELLDRNIPQGRGMVKWAPFATLPEQFETIQRYIMDQNKIDRPILSEDQLTELNIKLHEALQRLRPVKIRYYNDGFIDTITLTIHRIDSINFEIEGYIQQRQLQKLSLFDILDITILH